MPIYEYECRQCNACFEMLVFSGDDEPRKCPHCGAGDIHRQISCASFIGDGIGSRCAGGGNSGFS
ncbi:MAG: zinc ribbon domain-containing protein [Desulfobacteraceae bacterium]|nr:zinc ribbon domain-containing protein [Desulfobacteraceae bacterium]